MNQLDIQNIDQYMDLETMNVWSWHSIRKSKDL